MLKRLDAQQAISRQESLNEAIDNSISLQQFIAQLLIIFAAVAVLITVSGVSGVLAYLISIRTREIGIRMAIGASQRDVLLMVLAHGLRLSAAGLLIGLFGAWYVAGSLSAHLFNVTATDVGIYVMALGSLFLIAVAALSGAFLQSQLNGPQPGAQDDLNWRLPSLTPIPPRISAIPSIILLPMDSPSTVAPKSTAQAGTM